MLFSRLFRFKVTRRFNKHSQVSIVVYALNKKYAVKKAKEKLSEDKNLMPLVLV